MKTIKKLLQRDGKLEDTERDDEPAAYVLVAERDLTGDRDLDMDFGPVIVIHQPTTESLQHVGGHAFGPFLTIRDALEDVRHSIQETGDNCVKSIIKITMTPEDVVNVSKWGRAQIEAEFEARGIDLRGELSDLADAATDRINAKIEAAGLKKPLVN